MFKLLPRRLPANVAVQHQQGSQACAQQIYPKWPSEVKATLQIAFAKLPSAMQEVFT